MSLTDKSNEIIKYYDTFTVGEPYTEMIRIIAPEFSGEIKFSEIASYTVNKKNIFLKLNPQASLKENLEIILHEISHCFSSDGHGEEFQKVFEALKKRAKDYGYL